MDDGETTPGAAGFNLGLLVGVLIGEGHFGGDGRQPQVTLRMHTRHQRLFQWLERTFPGGRLYGPYHHGGRSYYQWMARGAELPRAVVTPLGGGGGPPESGRGGPPSGEWRDPAC